MTTDIKLFWLRRTIILQEFRQLDAIPLGFHDYQLPAWWDLNKNKCFDDLEHIDSTCQQGSELVIDELFTFAFDLPPEDDTIEIIAPGIFKKRYELGFDPRDFYSRFRLTYEPLDSDVKPFGELGC